MKSYSKDCIGVDPGKSGAIVYLSEKEFKFWELPLSADGGLNFGALQSIFNSFNGKHIFLERAVSFGMGTKGAFNYGRSFAFLEIAIKLSRNSVTYVEPGKWSKVMHQGIDSNLKAKVKSLVAVERLFPEHLKKIPRSPKSKKLHDGIVDALLIAGYGLGINKQEKDFY